MGDMGGEDIAGVRCGPMPTAQERDEQDAQDPFARSQKAPGYRIAARIEAPTTTA
jgi:hypothetical protein